jgi:hypothetical protein
MHPKCAKEKENLPLKQEYFSLSRDGTAQPSEEPRSDVLGDSQWNCE